MVLVTTTSAPDGLYVQHSGTAQEVLNAIEASLTGRPHLFLSYGHDGTNFFGLVKAK